MLSRKEHSYELKRNKKRERASILSEWENCTNLKALLCHAGRKIHKGWTDFTVAEPRRFIGLHVLDSISTSPRMETKLKT